MMGPFVFPPTKDQNLTIDHTDHTDFTDRRKDAGVETQHRCVSLPRRTRTTHLEWISWTAAASAALVEERPFRAA